MAYPRDQLHEFEELILDLHPHWWFMARSIFVLSVAVVFAIFCLVTGIEWLFWIAAVLLLVALGWFLVRFIKWATTNFVLTSDRVVYREGVIAKKGIEIPLERINTMFFEQGVFERMLGLGNLEIESASKDGAQVFECIKKPNAVQNEIYRQMEINENKKVDRMTTGISMHMHQNPHPQAVPQAPYPSDAPTQYQQPGPQPPPAPQQAPPQHVPPRPPASQSQPQPQQSSIYDQIEQLTRLRDQGMISEEEFQAKKTELLGRM